MQFLFYLVFFPSCIYFFFTKRRIDLFLFSFLSSVIYLFPAFLGYTMDPYDKADMNGIPIPDEAYVIYSLIFFVITITAIFYDINYGNDMVNKKRISIFENNKLLISCLLFSYFGCLMSIFKNGNIYFDDIDKVDLLARLDAKRDRWLMLMQHASILTLCISILRNKLLIVFLILPVFIFDFVFVGHRSTLAFAILTIIMVKSSSLGKLRIGKYILSLRGISIFFGVLFLGIFFLGIKDFLPFIKAGNIGEYLDYIGENTGAWLNFAFIFSEPSVIQATLTATINKNITNDFINPLDIVIGLVPFSVDMGIQRFGTYLSQEQTYPGLRWGTASNIWAFMWSSGRYYSLILYLLFFSSVLYLANRLYFFISGNFQIVLVWSMVIYLFYSNRNDLFYQLDMQKRIIGFSLIFNFLAYLLDVLTINNRNGK
jgi:hypothetical protein